MRIILGLFCVLFTSPLHAQSFYSSDQGSGVIVETFPGVQYSTGPLSGVAVDLLPGVTRYSYSTPSGEPRTGQRVDLGQRETLKAQPQEDKLDLFNEKPAPWDVPLFRER